MEVLEFLLCLNGSLSTNRVWAPQFGDSSANTI